MKQEQSQGVVEFLAQLTAPLSFRLLTLQAREDVLWRGDFTSFKLSSPLWHLQQRSPL